MDNNDNLAIANDPALDDYVPDVKLVFKNLTSNERKFVVSFLETFDGQQAAMQAYDIRDEMIARMKANRLMARDGVRRVINLLLEKAMGKKAIKFEIFKMGKTCFDPMVKIKALEIMAKINGQMEPDNTQITVNLSGMIKSAHDRLKVIDVTEVKDESSAKLGLQQ